MPDLDNLGGHGSAARAQAAVRVSIIIPALDEAQNIEACLAPLQPLRALGHEVLVVDGGSGDDTVALARPLADRVLVAARGRARQMNAGAALARGEVLQFLHADSRLPALAVETIAREAAARGSVWGRFDVRIEGHSPALRLVGAAMNLRSRLNGLATGDQGIFVSRDLYRRVGGYPEQDLMEDLELSRRLRSIMPPRCFRLRIATSGRRWDKHGAWRTILLMWRLRRAYFQGADPSELARRYPPHER